MHYGCYMKSHFVYWTQMGMLRPKEAYLPTWKQGMDLFTRPEAKQCSCFDDLNSPNYDGIDIIFAIVQKRRLLEEEEP
ncbi:hypothetical protein N7497_002250 [Penicillium chrysogenum]|uniref:Uncharacterized protein n=1 Tax=Penicillium chrysogenum TaxID=5076 RepID=A0ABQ8WWZ1_PENCH|nr:hypothetical protein N7524_010488 [Penicillium chrysogenum]KAJ5282586.1 hypothetical protein N7505_000566 [Penicillium chrysogenum]KAJ6169407.1 hypothetical protein N7497_002250 [Penicillium chrysogenum]